MRRRCPVLAFSPPFLLFLFFFFFFFFFFSLSLASSAACPSATVCRQYDVPCNETNADIDPDVAGADDDDVNYAEAYPHWCHVVNCTGLGSAMRGEIPCDVPANTTFLLLADTGMTGNLSFQTLLARVPFFFGNVNNASLRPKLLDLSDNAITGVQQLERPLAFWAVNTLQASVDLGANHIATLPSDVFTGLSMVGNLGLSGNGIRVVASSAFRSAVIAGNVDLRNNNMATIQSGAFIEATISFNLDLTGNKGVELDRGAFATCRIGGVQLRANGITSLTGVFFRSQMWHNLDLSGNDIRTLEGDSFLSCTLGNVYVNNSNIAAISPHAFSNTNVAGVLDLSDNSITSMATFAFYDVVSFGALQLQHNALTVLEPATFQGGTFAEIDLSNNVISHLPYGRNSSFFQATVLSLNLANNRLTTLPAGAFFGLSGGQTVNLSNNSMIVLENGWSNAFALDMALDTANNPSQCYPSELPNTLQSFLCSCANDSRSDVLGNGAYCSRAPCQPPNPAVIANAMTLCLQGYLSGATCQVTCNDGYTLLERKVSSITCLGGLWGQRPNHANAYPTCFPTTSTPAWKIALIALGSCAGGLLIAGVIYLLTNYRKQIRRQGYDLELKEHLLHTQTEQLDELRAAFTIDAMQLTLDSPIASGAFGEVWRGQWNGTVVAVKKLRRVLLDLDEASVREFESESTLMRTLRHPNIVAYFGAGTDDDGVPFLVCEFMAGALRGLLEHEALSDPKRVQLALDAARGMAYLHARALIHRDLKSGNLLVSATGTVKVADFGTSKLVKTLTGFDEQLRVPQFSGAQNTSNSQSLALTKGVGTLAWMAPEVLDGGRYGLPADVYSFGIVLWELATQTLPWLDKQRTWDIANAVLAGERPDLQLVAPDSPLLDPMQQCWRPDPRGRPTFEQVVTALTAANNKLKN